MLDNILPPKRLLHLDLLRIVAIFLVVFNHTGERGYLLFVGSAGSALYFPYMIASVLCKMAVPVFFMISGALLLPKQESYKELFTKRVLRMAVILILISVPYYAWLHRSQGLSVSSFLTYIYSNSASTSLWYLYSYIALLLMMPFLRNMVKGLKEKDFLYLIAGYILVSGVIPCLESCLWWADVTIHKSFNPILFMMPNVFYAIIGYYLEYVMDNHKNKKRRTILGIVFSIIALAITCFMTHRQLLNIQEYSTDQLDRFFSCFICIPAMTLYDIFKCSEEKARSATTQKLLPIFGGAVFGVYLIEKFARAVTESVYSLVKPITGSFVAAQIWVIAALTVSLLVILLLKNIPGIKKVLNKFI